MREFWAGFLYCYFVLNLISLIQIKYLIEGLVKENKAVFETYKGAKFLAIIMSSTLFLLVGVLLSLRGAYKFLKEPLNK